MITSTATLLTSGNGIVYALPKTAAESTDDFQYKTPILSGAALAALGASAAHGGLPLYKYVKDTLPNYHGAGRMAMKEAIENKAAAVVRARLFNLLANGFLHGPGHFKGAEELDPLTAAAIAGTAGIGSGALLTAGNKARAARASGNKILGTAAGAALLAPALKKVVSNVDSELPSDLAWLASKIKNVVRKSMDERARRRAITKLTDSTIDVPFSTIKEASDATDDVILPTIAAGASGLGGYALGSGVANTLMDKYTKKVHRDQFFEGLLSPRQHASKAVKGAATALGVVGAGLAGRKILKDPTVQGAISAVLQLIKHRRGLK
jgi:hypothetical protein